MLLEAVLVHLLAAKGPKHWRQAPQRPNQTELPRHQIERDGFWLSLRESPLSLLGFMLYLHKRITAGEGMHHQTAVDPDDVKRKRSPLFALLQRSEEQRPR